MAYRDNVQALCDKRSIVNPLREEDLSVAALVFFGSDQSYRKILGGEMNRASRLFLEAQAATAGDDLGGVQHVITGRDFTELKRQAAEYFAEMWLLDRPLITALREGESVILFWKPLDMEWFERLQYGVD